MKKLLLFSLALCLFAPLGAAQVNDRGPASTTEVQSTTPSTTALGDLNWYLDTEGLTGDIRMLGACIDSNTGHMWCTGAFDFTIAYIYEFDLVGGTLLNTYTQPAGNWAGWGWRDLCFDGAYLYAGNPNNGRIHQIDPANGQPTSVVYGIFPITPCRALAYDPVTDSFWTASFSSSIYQCFRNNTFNTYSGQGLTHYGAAMEELNNVIWWWSQDGGTGTLASEYDPVTHTLTGQSFEATTPLAGGIAGGAGGRNLGGGNWEIVGMFQGTPDHVGAFDLATSPDALTADTNQISEATGGVVNMKLDAGAANAGRNYIILGSVSGTSPGTPLPGGMVVLPLNWDIFTGLVINLLNTPIFSNFLGALDGSGTAAAKFDTLGPIPGAAGLTIYFAAALNAPWDFASNYVAISVVP